SRCLYDRSFSCLAFALLADGVPADKLYPMDIDRAFRKMSELKPHIKAWWREGSQSQQLIRDGEVDMIAMWSARAIDLIEDNVPVELVWNGAEIYYANLLVPKGDPNAKAAWQFCNFVAQAKPQADFAMLLPYGPANPEARALMPQARLRQTPAWPENEKIAFKHDAAWIAPRLPRLGGRWTQWLTTERGGERCHRWNMFVRLGNEGGSNEAAVEASADHFRRHVACDLASCGNGADGRGRDRSAGKSPSASGNHGDHPVGLVRQCAEAGAHHQARRWRRHGNHDAFPRSPRAGRDLGNVAQDSPGAAGPRRAYAHRADLCRRRRARRRAQGEDQQDRAALLWGEHELSRNRRAIPQGVSGRESPLRLSRLGQQGGRVSARCFHSAAAVSRNSWRRPRRARTLQHRPAGTLRGQFGPARADRRVDALSAGVR